MRTSRQLGTDGEALVAARYESAGYRLLERNWRCAQGEIDIIARRGSTVVICEVKTRSTSRYGTPAYAVDRKKQARLRRLAALWLASSETPYAMVRFDVAAVTAEAGEVHVEIIEGAF